MNLLDFFDTDLPIDRKSFVYRVLFLFLVLAWLYAFVTGETFLRLEKTPQSVILVLFWSVVSLYYGTAVAKRAQDFDSSGMLQILTFVAFVGYVAWLRFVPWFSDMVAAQTSFPAFAWIVWLQCAYLMFKSDGYS